MGEKSVKLVRLRCNDTDDAEVDELFMLHNGARCWPPSGEFSMTRNTEVVMDLVRDFGAAESMRFSLQDEEDLGPSDSLGFLDIFRFEPNGSHERNFGSGGGSYTLSYSVQETASEGDAQLRLVPREMASPEGRVGGAGGELFATTVAGPTGRVLRLWFCTRAGDAASAGWDLVAGSRPFPGAPLSEGAAGTDVKRIQMRLNMSTGTQLNGDGEFGPITRDAVIAFQEREGMALTGVVDAETWERLHSL